MFVSGDEAFNTPSTSVLDDRPNVETGAVAPTVSLCVSVEEGITKDAKPFTANLATSEKDIGIS
jgi:hypothetical protein